MPKKTNKSIPKINNLKLKKPHDDDDKSSSDEYETEHEEMDNDSFSESEYNEFMRSLLKKYPLTPLKKYPPGYKNNKSPKNKSPKNESPKNESPKNKSKSNKSSKKEKEKNNIITRSVAKKNKLIIDDYLDEDDDEEYIPSEEIDSENTYEDEEEEGEEDEDEDTEFDKKNTNFNIYLSIDGNDLLNYDDYEDEYYEYEDEDEDEDTENEDDEISSSSEEEEEEKEEKKYKNNKRKNDKLKKNKSVKDDKKHKKENEEEKKEEEKQLEEIASKINENYNEDEFLEFLENMNSKNPSNLVSECISMCKEKILISKKKQERKNKKEKERNSRIFKKIMYDKNTMNDSMFFNKLELSQQKKIIKEMREINKIIRSEKPYKLTLLEANMPTSFKAVAMKKVSLMHDMDIDNHEYYKIKNWVDTFMKIPFGTYKTLPIDISTGLDSCTEFMENSRKILDDAVYGLNDAKMQIMQLLGQLITNPSSIGSAVGIQGSPGVGKTNLAKEGISKILGRPFAFIALGGATDSSFLEGHSYAYEGSSWGKIVQILIDSQCMNPVIYFDELDKVSDTPKGDEIIGILTHLIDTSQNNQFHDKYFAEIDFDLSKCLFIFTYNDESKINPILRDRMYKIQIKNYNKKEKTIIADNYLLPKIREQVKFNPEEIIISDEIINYIIDNYCEKEDGVRNLKRCLEIIHTKLNLCRLIKPGSSIFQDNSITSVEFPLTITKDIVDKLIKRREMSSPALSYMYI